MDEIMPLMFLQFAFILSIFVLINCQNKGTGKVKKVEEDKERNLDIAKPSPANMNKSANSRKEKGGTKVKDEENEEVANDRLRKKIEKAKIEKEHQVIIREALSKGELRPEDDNETINECRSNWDGPMNNLK